ncbi:MAG: dihydroorotate dehydrogenase electron transfer subunit, partial [Clostridia bacterium]|nr:dihydroorotate dehydrogenase electron transfer subunit [Clostridia bacterium]
MAELVKGLLLENEAIGEDYFRLEVSAPSLARQAQPGQFVQLKCGETLDPLLRRPISIHRYEPE